MTLEETERLKSRVSALETLVADLITVTNKMTTAATVSRVVGHMEEGLADQEVRITTLETQVAEILEDPYNEQQDS